MTTLENVLISFLLILISWFINDRWVRVNVSKTKTTKVEKPTAISEFIANFIYVMFMYPIVYISRILMLSSSENIDGKQIDKYDIKQLDDINKFISNSRLRQYIYHTDIEIGKVGGNSAIFLYAIVSCIDIIGSIIPYEDTLQLRDEDIPIWNTNTGEKANHERIEKKVYGIASHVNTSKYTEFRNELATLEWFFNDCAAALILTQCVDKNTYFFDNTAFKYIDNVQNLKPHSLPSTYRIVFQKLNNSLVLKELEYDERKWSNLEWYNSDKTINREFKIACHGIMTATFCYYTLCHHLFWSHYSLTDPLATHAQRTLTEQNNKELRILICGTSKELFATNEHSASSFFRDGGWLATCTNYTQYGLNYLTKLAGDLYSFDEIYWLTFMKKHYNCIIETYTKDGYIPSEEGKQIMNGTKFVPNSIRILTRAWLECRQLAMKYIPKEENKDGQNEMIELINRLSPHTSSIYTHKEVSDTTKGLDIITISLFISFYHHYVGDANMTINPYKYFGLRALRPADAYTPDELYGLHGFKYQHMRHISFLPGVVIEKMRLTDLLNKTDICKSKSKEEFFNTYEKHFNDNTLTEVFKNLVIDLEHFIQK